MNVMWRMTMRGLWEHRRRMFGTLIAVFIGVSFLAGTLSLSDTLGSAIDGTLATAYSTTDVVVQSSGVQSAALTSPAGRSTGPSWPLCARCPGWQSPSRCWRAAACS